MKRCESLRKKEVTLGIRCFSVEAKKDVLLDLYPSDSLFECFFDAAADAGYDDVVKYLATKGIDVNAKDEYGNTSLHFAAGHDETVEGIKFLIDIGADVNVQNKNGNTPLHIAVGATWRHDEDGDYGDGDTAFVEILVCKAKADVNVKNKKGETPLHIAMEDDRYGHEIRIAELLVSHGADVNAKDNGGRDPLHKVGGIGWSCRHVAELLVVSGADVNAIDYGGHTPLDYWKDYEELGEYLRNVGAKTSEQMEQKQMEQQMNDMENYEELEELLRGEGTRNLRQKNRKNKQK
jgi:ankyrin repeat protein